MKNLIFAAVLLTPAFAGAQQNIKFGNLEVNPFVSTQESYDSNIYLTKDLRKTALINRSALGVDLVENIGSRYDLKGGYNLELLGYSRETEVNNATHHNANLAFTGRLPKEITVTAGDNWKQTTDQATSQLVQRAERVENTAAVNVNAPIRGKFGFNLAAQHVYNNYLASINSALDREEFLTGFDVNYKWQPKTMFFVNYRYGKLAYRVGDTNDATYNNVDVGATASLANKVVGTVKAGMQARNYAKHVVGAKSDITTAQYSAQALWKAMEKTEVTLLAKRGNIETNYGNARFYTSTLTDLSVSREINKFKATAGLNYEDVRYSDKSSVTDSKKRADENFAARAGLEYNIQKWLKAEGSFTYRDRSSNYDQFEYKDNVTYVGLKAMF